MGSGRQMGGKKRGEKKKKGGFGTQEEKTEKVKKRLNLAADQQAGCQAF